MVATANPVGFLFLHRWPATEANLEGVAFVNKEQEVIRGCPAAPFCIVSQWWHPKTSAAFSTVANSLSISKCLVFPTLDSQPYLNFSKIFTGNRPLIASSSFWQQPCRQPLMPDSVCTQISTLVCRVASPCEHLRSVSPVMAGQVTDRSISSPQKFNPYWMVCISRKGPHIFSSTDFNLPASQFYVISIACVVRWCSTITTRLISNRRFPER